MSVNAYLITIVKWLLFQTLCIIRSFVLCCMIFYYTAYIKVTHTHTHTHKYAHTGM